MSGANAGATGRRSAAAVSSEALPKDLGRAFLASHLRPSARVLRSFPDDELDDLLAEMIELPCLDTSLQFPLPGC